MYEVHENANKIDEGSSTDYKPRYFYPKHKHPNYSFGYHFEHDYSNAVPPPNNYDIKRVLNPKVTTFNKYALPHAEPKGPSAVANAPLPTAKKERTLQWANTTSPLTWLPAAALVPVIA